MTENNQKIAVLIPCLNEAATIGDVVAEFKMVLPSADVYVFDNNSTDGTAAVAAAAGAIVRYETRQGKGCVVARMFRDVDADIYILVDGDGTYNAHAAPHLVAKLTAGPYDMVNAARLATGSQAYRPGHAWGNLLLSRLVQMFFGLGITDMLSGYKVFSRRYVKSFPAMSRGFEIETELVVHALELGMPIAEMAAPYRERPPGSHSKLCTYRDGFRILRLIGFLVREERPLAFFTAIACALAGVSIGLGASVVSDYYDTGLVPRLPTAVLAMGLMLSALLAQTCGFILDTVTRGRREMKLLSYLHFSSPVTNSRADAVASPMASGHMASSSRRSAETWRGSVASTAPGAST